MDSEADIPEDAIWMRQRPEDMRLLGLGGGTLENPAMPLRS